MCQEQLYEALSSDGDSMLQVFMLCSHHPEILKNFIIVFVVLQ
jgi:hypothetical protein